MTEIFLPINGHHITEILIITLWQLNNDSHLFTRPCKTRQSSQVSTKNVNLPVFLCFIIAL